MPYLTMVLYKSPNTEVWLNHVLCGRLLEEQLDKIKIIWIKALLFYRTNIVLECACHEEVIVFNGKPEVHVSRLNSPLRSASFPTNIKNA
jgi:hypothetical protein